MQRWLSPEFSSLRSEQLPSDPPVAMALKDLRGVTQGLKMF